MCCLPQSASTGQMRRQIAELLGEGYWLGTGLDSICPAAPDATLSRESGSAGEK
jgi:hypothetical protein